MRALFAAVSHFLKSDMDRAVDECVLLDPAFPERLELAVATVTYENACFNAGSVYTKFPLDALENRRYIFDRARLRQRMPAYTGDDANLTLPQALKQVVDRTIEMGPRYQTQKEIENVDFRYRSAHDLKDRVNIRLREAGLMPL